MSLIFSKVYKNIIVIPKKANHRTVTVTFASTNRIFQGTNDLLIEPYIPHFSMYFKFSLLLKKLVQVYSFSIRHSFIHDFFSICCRPKYTGMVLRMKPCHMLFVYICILMIVSLCWSSLLLFNS